MKNSIELRQDRAELIGKADSMLNLAKDETRDFTNDEQVSYDDMMKNIDKLAKDIQTVERQEKLNAEMATNVGSAPIQKTSETKEARAYSIFKAINDSITNNLSGVEKEMHEEAVNEARSAGRDITGVGIPTCMLESRADISQGSSSIAPVNVLGFADALREASVYDKVGANILTGLSANTNIPVTAKQSVEWEGENDAAASGGANFSKVELTPVRLASYVHLSKQLLMQNGQSVENAIMRDLGRAVAQKMDQAIFNDTTISGAPASIGATAGITTFTEAAAFAAGSSVMSDFVAAEQAVAEAEGLQGSLKYVANPILMKELRQGALVSSVSAGMQGNLVNGYECFFSVGCAKSAGNYGDAYFGDFSQLYLGMFGPMDVLTDIYTRAAHGQIRVVLNNYMDWGLANPAAIANFRSLLA